MEPRYCQYSQCGKEIPLHLIRKYGASRKYCDRQCAYLAITEQRKEQGFYQRFSQAGLAKLRAMQAQSGIRPGHAKRSQAMKEHNRLVPRKHSSGWHKTKKKRMDISAIIEQIIATAKLKPVEERIVVWRYGLRGETRKKLVEVIELCKADKTITVKHIGKEWLRNRQAKAMRLMRSSFSTLSIDPATFRAECEKSEKYKDFCEDLLGYTF